MIDFELEQLRQNSEWRLVLAAYRERQTAAREADPEHDGWLLRLRSIDDVADERLPRIHGKLIALGYLKFELGGRTDGVKYQVSPQGVQALNRLENVDSADDESVDEAA